MSVIQRIKELREKATQGEWKVTSKYGYIEVEDPKEGYIVEVARMSDTYVFAGSLESADKGTDNADYIAYLHNTLPEILAYIESLEKKVEAGEFLARRMYGFTPTLYPITDDKGESNLVYVNDALTRWHKTVSDMLDDYRKQVE